MGREPSCARATEGWILLNEESDAWLEGLALVGIHSVTLRYVAERKKLGEFTAGTARRNWYTLAMFADAVGPDLAVSRVTREHVERWMLGLNRSPGTVRVHLSTVRTFFRWCVDHDLCRRDPTRGIKGPKRAQREPRALTAEQVADNLDHADTRLRLVQLLEVQEALRVGAIARLTVDDVDLDQRLVTVIEKGDKEVVKPLSDETADALKAYLDECPAGPGMPLIRSRNHPWRGVSASHLSWLVSQLMYESGVKARPYDGRSGHAYRHTLANDMLDNGAELRDVQEMLSHEHLGTTSIYTRRLRALGRLRDAAGGRSYSR